MTHTEILELLPWYATLDEERRREIDTHVGNCAECAREFAEIQAVQKKMVRIDDTPEPSAFLLQRTLARIEAHETTKTASVTRWQRLLGWWRLSPAAVRGLIAAQAVLLIVLAVGVVYFQHEVQSFYTLGGPTGSASGVRLTLGFQPEISEEALRETLRKIGGNIVGGPSALGLYTVQIPKDSDPDLVLAQLRASPSVRFVQRNPD